MNMRELLAAKAAASDASAGQPAPPGVEPVRRGRASVLSVRLSPQELDALTTQAHNDGIPVSTLARALIVRAMHANNEPSIARIEEAVMAALERFETRRKERLPPA
jgi:hypothetical protein